MVMMMMMMRWKRQLPCWKQQRGEKKRGWRNSDGWRRSRIEPRKSREGWRRQRRDAGQRRNDIELRRSRE